MVIKVIDIGKDFSNKIAMDSTAILLFQEFNCEEEVVLDFRNVDFISRSFAQEYVYQRYHSNVNIIEKNMNEFIKGLMEVVERDFEKTCLS